MSAAKRRATWIVGLIWLCLSPLAVAEQITVAAAADLQYALQTLAARYEKKTGDNIKISFGSSGNLFSQIEGGAPYDLFFSADLEYPRKLAAAGLVEGASLRTYGAGRLVLWVTSGLGLDPAKLKMELLAQPSVKRIAIANPQHAPYGRAAMAAIEHFGLKDSVADKLVFGENISQAAQFVQSGNAQAGLIALSLAMSPSMKDSGKYWELPSDSYPDLRQGAAVISSSKHKQAAQAFLDYVSSAEGVSVLEEYGFRIPQGK